MYHNATLSEHSEKYTNVAKKCKTYSLRKNTGDKLGKNMNYFQEPRFFLTNHDH